MTILFKEAGEWLFDKLDKLDHRSSKVPCDFFKMARNLDIIVLNSFSLCIVIIVYKL